MQSMDEARRERESQREREAEEDDQSGSDSEDEAAAPSGQGDESRSPVLCRDVPLKGPPALRKGESLKGMAKFHRGGTLGLATGA